MLVRTYVQRLRMEASLRHVGPLVPPAGISLLPWEPDLIDAHAEVKWLAFRDTVDAAIFPNLGHLAGCLQLMQSIATHSGFVPGATWLASGPDGPCGCVQGVRMARRTGMIQNLGVVPECQGQGVGTALLVAALRGFRDAGLNIAQLEVSARNASALHLYQAAGFFVRKSFYRETRAEYTEYAI